MRSLVASVSGLLVALLLACADSPPLRGAPARREFNPAPQLGPVIQELSQVADTGPGLRMAIWLPVEAWIAIVMSAGHPERQVRQTLAPLEPYNILAGVDLPEGPKKPGSGRAIVAENLTLVDPAGEAHPPIPDAELPPLVGKLFNHLAPLLSSGLGNLGKSYHLIAFPRTFDPLEPGRVSVRFFDSEFSWRLPVGALSAPRRCPVDNEQLDGAWNYCPWHGVQLE